MSSMGLLQNNHGSKPMVPCWDRCTTHFCLFEWGWGLGRSLGVQGFDPWPNRRALPQNARALGFPRPGFRSDFACRRKFGGVTTFRKPHEGSGFIYLFTLDLTLKKKPGRLQQSCPFPPNPNIPSTVATRSLVGALVGDLWATSGLPTAGGGMALWRSGPEATSSRSHCIFTMELIQKQWSGGTCNQLRSKAGGWSEHRVLLGGVNRDDYMDPSVGT